MSFLSTETSIRRALVAPAIVLASLVAWIGTFHVHNPLVLVPVSLLLGAIPVSFVLEIAALRAALNGSADVFPRTPANVACLACGALVLLACGSAALFFVWHRAFAAGA